MRPAKLPAIVITGFLGAGKTTLVNHLLESTRPMQIGIVVNEFGEVGIDGQLIVADERAVIEINNGCVCCTVRTDLVASVRDMLMRFGDRLERLIIETSGLADPAPVLQTFLADPDVRERVELESVVAVVDAMHARAQLHDDIAREQVVFADRIVINKTDLVSSDAVDALVAGIRRLNPTARIEYAQRSRIDARALFGQQPARHRAESARRRQPRPRTRQQHRIVRARGVRWYRCDAFKPLDQSARANARRTTSSHERRAQHARRTATPAFS